MSASLQGTSSHPAPSLDQPSASSSSLNPVSTSAAAAVFQRLHPDQYLSRFLIGGYRPDGRRSKAFREAIVNVGSISTADGSALARIGETTMLCGIKAEIAQPDSSRPNEGFIVPNVDLPALCSPRFKPGPPGDEAQTLSNWLYELLISAGTIKPESLVIVTGRAAWSLYIDVICINYDGNAFDAAVLAVMAALRNTRLPRANFDVESGRVVCQADELYHLPLGPLPLACSFGTFSSILLPDPTSFETPLLATTTTIALDDTGSASLVRRQGLGSANEMKQAWKMAEERVKDLRLLLV